jgi:hypothetical protein
MHLIWMAQTSTKKAQKKRKKKRKKATKKCKEGKSAKKHLYSPIVAMTMQDSPGNNKKVTKLEKSRNY